MQSVVHEQPEEESDAALRAWREPGEGGVRATMLLRRLRWATVGTQFNWAEVSAPPQEVRGSKLC